MPMWIPWVQGKLWGLERQLFTPTSPSTHSASSPFHTAFRWLPVSRQMQRWGAGGGY